MNELINFKKQTNWGLYHSLSQVNHQCHTLHTSASTQTPWGFSTWRQGSDGDPENRDMKCLQLDILGKCVLLLRCHLCRVRQALRRRINRGSCGQVTSTEQEGRPIPDRKTEGSAPPPLLPSYKTVPKNEKWWRRWKTTKQNKISSKEWTHWQSISPWR